MFILVRIPITFNIPTKVSLVLIIDLPNVHVLNSIYNHT